MSESTLHQWAGRAAASDELYAAAKHARDHIERVHRRHRVAPQSWCDLCTVLAELRAAVAKAEDNATDRKRAR